MYKIVKVKTYNKHEKGDGSGNQAYFSKIIDAQQFGYDQGKKVKL